ncbi:MAG: MFS transporter [Candidatus Polarisedimenticolia bacterium]
MEKMREPLWSLAFVRVTLATMVVFFGLYFLVLALPGFVASRGAGPALIGWLVALPSLTAAAARLAVSGSPVRRFGQKPFLLVGLILFAVASAGHALLPGRLGLFTSRVLLGIGWGWTSTALGTLVTQLTPASRRGEAIGIWGMAPTIAMAAGPATGALLLSVGGHEAVFHVAGGLALLSAALVATVREPRGAAVEAPQTGGLLSNIPRGAILPSAVALVSSLSYGVVIAFLPLEFAGNPRRAAAWFTLYAACIMIARPLLGRLSDRVGRLAIIHPTLLLGAAGMALLGLRSPGALWASALLYGVGVGGGAFPGLLALTVDRSPHDQRVAALAVYFTAYDLSIAAGAALMGPLYAWGGLPAVSFAAAAGIVIGQLMLLRARSAS